MSEQTRKYDHLSRREVQIPINSGATLPHCPYPVMCHGDKFTVELVEGYARGEEEVNFGTSHKGSAVNAPRVIGGTAFGRVDGDHITLSVLEQGGRAIAHKTLNIEVVRGWANAGTSATVGVIHRNAFVDAFSDLRATEGIYGMANARSIHTPIIGESAQVNARHGLVRCDQIDGEANGHNIAAINISRDARAKALKELTVERLEGLAEAERIVITGEIIGTRFVNKTGWEQVLNLDPMAPHDVYSEAFGRATAKIFHLKGVIEDIDLGRLVTIYQNRQVWNDEMKRPHGENARKKRDLFVKMQERDDREVYPWSFFDTSFEVRDLATGKVTSIFTIEGKTVENAKLKLTATLNEIIER
ncbi:hypothetical protein [Shimazuella kribbensis]|uniref:hypothetical protein n=1 Tax=Shimazuella kribbensis TaxID=139808 RepID=UPI00041C7F60|nr:hypothetical protein [Shimazuella kribbensis]